MLLVGEQIGQVGSQASIRRSEPFMGVVPSSRERIGCSLLEEGRPSCMPGIKGSGKILLIRFTEGREEFFQFNTGLEFRIVRQIPRNDLFLVEVTHLDGDVTKELSHARSAIKNDRLNGIPLLLQSNPSLSVYLGRFTVHFLGIEVFLQMRGTENTDTEAPFEEGNIGDDNDRVRDMMMYPYRCVTYTVPYPVLALPVFLR